jgi:hypothetical protein
MFASLHEANHLSEAIEARSLHRPQWVRLKEWHHSFGQLLESSDAELLSITMIRGDLTTPEELSKLLKERDIPLVLHHAKLGKDLPADFHRGLPVDADEEASLSVDEADDPFGTQAFLLVVCTDRIFTHYRVPSDPPEFPANSRMHTPPLLATGASDSLTLGPL